MAMTMVSMLIDVPLIRLRVRMPGDRPAVQMRVGDPRLLMEMVELDCAPLMSFLINDILKIRFALYIAYRICLLNLLGFSRYETG